MIKVAAFTCNLILKNYTTLSQEIFKLNSKSTNSFATISKEVVNSIMHSCKSFLSNCRSGWIKMEDDPDFETAMDKGCFTER